MTSVDVELCVLAIRSSCAWPLSIAIVKRQKRLFPHLFSWTQTSIETLLLLGITLNDRYLRDICLDEISTKEIEGARSILREWLHDIGQLDGVAEWACSWVDDISIHAEVQDM
jgi:hypothetical protein